MDLEEYIFFITNIPPSEKKLKLTYNLWASNEIKIYDNQITNLNNLLETFKYIFERYGKGIFIKIINNKIDNFIQFKNENYVHDFFHKKIYIDNYIIKNYDEEYEIGWIYNMFAELCDRRTIPDCEFFINYFKEFPMNPIDRTYADVIERISNFDDSKPLYQYPILSFTTSDSYKDYPIPNEHDYYRIYLNVFGVKDYIAMKWENKEDIFLWRGIYNKKNEYFNNKLSSLKFKIDTGYSFVDERSIIQNNKIINLKLTNELLCKEVDLIAKYKYIFVIDDLSELSNLMFTGSCILIIDSEWNNWFSKYLIESYHYILIDKDLKNLENVMKWCIENDEKCEKIGNNAREFALKFLSKNGLFDYLQNLLFKITDVNGITSYGNIELEKIQFYFQYTSNIENMLSLPKVNLTTTFNHTCKQDIYSYNFNEAISILLVNGLTFTECKEIYKNKFLCNYKLQIFYLKKNLSHYEGVNEFFIGYNCINNLRKEIPNFTQTIFLEMEDLYTYSVYVEYVDGITFTKFLQSKYTYKSYIEIIIQIFMSLELANERYSFNHGNLHPDKIIIRELREPIKIIYNLSERNWAIISKYIPVITDYKNSTCLSNHFNGNNFTRMFIGKNFMKPKKISDDINFFLKKIGKNFNNKITMTNPMNYLTNIITKEEIKNNKVKFGVLEEQNVEKKELISQMQAEEIMGNKNRYTNLTENLFKHSFPKEEIGYGNVILQTELLEIINTVFLDCKIKITCTMTASEQLENCINFIKQLYTVFIEETKDVSFDFSDKNVDLWALKIFLKKYINIINNSPTGEKFKNDMKNIAKATLKDAVLIGTKNTLKFYNRYIEK